MVLMDREERQRGQQPFLGFEQKNSLVEVAFFGKSVSSNHSHHNKC